MRIFKLLFILLINSTLWAQTHTNYIPYHQACRKAEKYFIDSNYQACFKTYDSVFANYEILFPRDCFLAAQMAFKTKHDSLAVNYLVKAVPFGLNAELIFDNDTTLLLRNIVKSKFWNNYTIAYPRLHQAYLDRVDWKLMKELYNLIYIDQKWRVKNNSWFNRNFRKGLEKKFDVVNRKQMIFLDSVFKTRGYPGIWLTGVGDSAVPAFNRNNNLTELFAAILYHYDSTYIKHGEFLKNEIRLGHIHPRTYALIRDFQDRFLVKDDKKQKMFYNIWWEASNYSELEFEKHCNEIGCPTKKHMRQLYKALGSGSSTYWTPF